MKIMLDDIAANPREWHALRRGRISSSKIATICGLNPYESPLELWARETGKLPAIVENDDMWLGTKMQPVIQQLVERRHKIKLQDANCLVQHADEHWIIASPDCWEKEQTPGITEIKNTSRMLADRWSESAPAGPLLQLQWQLGACAMRQGHLAGLVGGSAQRLKFFHVPFSADLFELAVERGYQFKQLVERDMPPAAGRGDLKLVNDLIGKRREDYVDLTDSAGVSDLLREYDRALESYTARKAALKDASDALDTAKARIAQHMGKCKHAICDNTVITAKMIDVKEHVREASSYLKLSVRRAK